MKKAKQIISLFAAALLCALPLLSVPMKAEAAAPVTYSVVYNESENTWYYQTGQWDADAEKIHIYYLEEKIKDGDYVVVADGGNGTLQLNVQLGNLTVVNAASAVIHTKGITDAYVLNNSCCAINGTVKNAYVYGYSVVNFNNNVEKLEIAGEDGLLKASVGVAGTIGHAKAYLDTTHFEIYNVAAGQFLVDKGELKTAETAYSKTAPAAPAPVPAPAAPSAGAADDLDDVPKTGDVNLVFGLVSAAAVCFAGASKMRKH